VDEWKGVVNAIGDIVEEAMFICNDDGITFRGIDPAHVALLDVTFPKSSFEEFESKTSFFGLKVNDFKNLLNAASNGDIVELQITGSGKMNVVITGSFNMEYSLRLIEKTEVNTPIPKVDGKSKVVITPGIFSKIISNIEKVSEYLTIECFANKIQFSGKGDIGDAKIDLTKENSELSILDVLEESSSMYSIEYLAKIIRNIGKTCTNVNMEYGTKTPMKMQFEMPSMTRVEFYLAPRVE